VIAAFWFGLLLSVSAQPPAEVLAQVQVHGNTLTSTEQILKLAGLSIGMSLQPTTPAEVEARLRRSGAFDGVEVRKRLASIADSSQILLVIVVDEGPVRIEWDSDQGGPARAVRRRRLPFLFSPVLDVEDGYGLTYGAQFALPEIAGADSRLSFPLTWGGERRAAAELEKSFTRGPLTRVLGGVGIDRRVNPFFDQPDTRRRLWVRADRAVFDDLTVNASAGWTRVTFEPSPAPDRFVSLGVEAVLDTRVDPALPRNAVYGRAGWQRLAFEGSPAVVTREIDIRGYAGLIGQSVLIARAQHLTADAPLPAYQKYLLGGMENLRGFRAGTAAGDTLASGSLELRVPLTSPLSIGKVGVSAFADAATVYDHGQRLGDQTFQRGAGGGVWFAAAVLRLNLVVARGVGSGTRVHFGTSLAF
jgi:outer membrane protein assembly factor BamA